MSSSTPLVSIITATYNRSNVLALAIKSVQRQTFIDWEHCVIGDAWTDDTETVVKDIQEPRRRFVNLPENFGEQSRPNNKGFDRARGRYIAYLNHDDIWFSDHLATCVAGLESTGADMVYTLLNVVKRDPNRWQPNRLPGAGRDFVYDPRLQVPASCWLLRRQTIECVGPWRSWRESHIFPSQEWLFRTWKFTAHRGPKTRPKRKSVRPLLSSRSAGGEKGISEQSVIACGRGITTGGICSACGGI